MRASHNGVSTGYDRFHSVGDKNRRSRPVSRVLSRTVIHLGHASPHGSSDLPGSFARAHSNAPLFGLAPGGVCPATRVATRAVRSYRTISPLPRRTGAVYFLWHFPWARAPQALPGTLPCGARTFLPPSWRATAWPTPPPTLAPRRSQVPARNAAYSALRLIPVIWAVSLSAASGASAALNSP